MGLDRRDTAESFERALDGRFDGEVLVYEFSRRLSHAAQPIGFRSGVDEPVGEGLDIAERRGEAGLYLVHEIGRAQPTRSLTIAGRPHAIASLTTRPQVSPQSEGRTRQSAAA